MIQIMDTVFRFDAMNTYYFKAKEKTVPLPQIVNSAGESVLWEPVASRVT